MEGGDGGGVDRRRRLTLAPEMGSGGSGSRFAVLAPIDEGETAGAEEIASQVAMEVLEGEDSRGGGDGRDWIAVGWRQSEEGLLQEFWEYAGFPMPESRPWEASSSSTVISSAGTSCVRECRSPEVMSRSAPAVVVPVVPGPTAGEMRRGRSSSPPAGNGRILVRPRVRMGWRGPLPKPGVTPPPCLGTSSQHPSRRRWGKWPVR